MGEEKLPALGGKSFEALREIILTIIFRAPAK